jgi:hypothetical protein
MRRNPMIALKYAVENPKKVGMAVLGAVLLVALLAAGLAFELIPTWTMLFGIAALTTYAAYGQYNRIEFLRATSEVTAGRLQPGAGAVKVNGTARPAGDDRVGYDEPEHLAYRQKRERKRQQHRGDGDVLDNDTETRHDSGAVPFYVADDSGQVLVDASRANLDLDWDDKSRSGSWTEHTATLDPGDEVTVYGTALAPGDHTGSEFVEAFANERSEAPTETFADHAANESVVVSSTVSDPQFIVTDRAGWSLLGRAVATVIAAVLATVLLVALGIGAALGALPW